MPLARFKSKWPKILCSFSPEKETLFLYGERRKDTFPHSLIFCSDKLGKSILQRLLPPKTLPASSAQRGHTTRQCLPLLYHVLSARPNLFRPNHISLSTRTLHCSTKMPLRLPDLAARLFPLFVLVR